MKDLDPDNVGCTVDVGSLERMLYKSVRLYFHGIPTPLDSDGEEDEPDIMLQITSVSLIDGDGERYVDLPEGGLTVRVPYFQLEPFIEE